MDFVEDYSDDRQKAWCVYCGDQIVDVAANRDHVPTKSLLSKHIRERGAIFDRKPDHSDGYLPQILVCKACNSGFSEDEAYLLCCLHALRAGSLYPDREFFPDSWNILRSNRHIVRLLKADASGQLPLFNNLEPFILQPDMERIKNVVVKNARGHVYHEIGEPMLELSSSVMVTQISAMTDDQRAEFEAIGSGMEIWPEVGSRMMLQMCEDSNLAGG